MREISPELQQPLTTRNPTNTVSPQQTPHIPPSQWQPRGKQPVSRTPHLPVALWEPSQSTASEDETNWSGSYNRYVAIAARVVRRSLNEEKRIIAERRGESELRFAKWEVSLQWAGDAGWRRELG
ncbi:hypothetical protein J1614_000393 [Plenodomus biglobosus]|nr:hypothetical protein J1614_000393 [Plenodomus biglobosus]